MIPKVIHYCWFGKGAMSSQAIQYIEGWKTLHPDYQIKCWSEENFDLSIAPIYVQQAYKCRKYAFVSDYVRLWALYYEGGIYLDTDVEVIKSFDDLLVLPAFIGFEANKNNTVETAVIGSEPKLAWTKELLEYYDTHSFLQKDGTLDMTPNPTIFSNIFESRGLLPNGKKQVYKEKLHVFPVDYFAPLSSTRVLRTTNNTYCIHHFAGTWREYGWRDIISKILFDKILGRRITDKLVLIKRKLFNYINEE